MNQYYAGYLKQQGNNLAASNVNYLLVFVKRNEPLAHLPSFSSEKIPERIWWCVQTGFIRVMSIPVSCRSRVLKKCFVSSTSSSTTGSGDPGFALQS